ncbi:HlyD family type I secretion periplasmic adaptor subunit [Frigidibacter sp. MR17.14]|uniref:HlyD family type I secretion periplasmic adaptor subunit n=1 Tax=Frigidibacter sp. MR17.14 TaxID=3126509 RepID=UPI003012DF27
MTADTLTPALSADPVLRTELGPSLRLAALAAPALILALAGWAAVTPLSGAVIASGEAVVLGQNRKLQHLDGGIVAAIHAHNGDRVEAGQVLVELDPTLLQTNLGIARTRLAEALALQARLEAEQEGLTSGRPGPALTLGAMAGHRAAGYLGAEGIAPASDLDRAVEGQELIRDARATTRAGQDAQLAERIAQFEGQRDGLDRLIATKQDQLRFIEEDLVSVETLVKQGLAAKTRLLDTQRSRADMLGQIAQARTERDGIANSIRDAQLERARTEGEFREQVATDLRKTTGDIEELVQQIVTYRAQLDRVELRAPVSGVIHEMAVATVGGVVTPGETVAQIVPLGDGVEFDLKLDPRSVDQVHPGQTARVKMPVYDDKTLPEVFGHVAQVSPATVTDERTGTSYYRVRLEVPAEELAKLPEPPMPGMPVEAFLETGERTALSWLLKPVSDHLDRAFRER